MEFREDVKHAAEIRISRQIILLVPANPKKR
jgi:hypothetical protein